MNSTPQNNPGFASNKKADWGESKTWYWKNLSSHWRVVGENNKSVIVLIHGFGASSAHWRFNASYFAKAGFRVYGIDLIGFGKSEQPSTRKIKKLDNNFWSEQIGAFLKEVAKVDKDSKAILIGNSIGGLTALTTSKYYPELVSAVIAAPLPDPVLMGPSNDFMPIWVKNLKNFLLTLFFKLLPLELLIPLIARTKLINGALQLAYHRSIKSDLSLQRIVKEPAKRKTAARALRAMCIGMGIRKNIYTAPFLLDHLAKSTNRPPILLVWGRQDKLVPLIIGKRLIAKHPWLKLLILENTGHCPHDETPITFNQNILSWLKINLQI